MAWYRVGKANMTNGSDVVTGVGTDWIATAREGDVFLAIDNLQYEIVQVASATSLRIYPAYKGVTNAAQDYAIIPTQSRVAEVAPKLATLINRYQGIADGAGQGKFPAGTAGVPSLRGAADENTGVNFAGNDVLELLAGGVVKGRVTLAGLLDAAGNPLLSASNAVGPLTSGAAIQYGENANGSYVRFAGGLIVCMRYTPHITLPEPVPKGGFIPKVRREFPHLFNGQPLFVQSMLQGADITNTHAAAAQEREFDSYLAWDTDFLVLSDVPVSRYALFDIAVGVWK